MSYKLFNYINREFFCPTIDTDNIRWNCTDKYSEIPQFLKDEIKSYINNDDEITKEAVKKKCLTIGMVSAMRTLRLKKSTTTKPLGSL